MSKWVKKLVENAFGIDRYITDWSDLECDRCESSAVTHVQVSIDDAMNHSDMVILRMVCDECFEDVLDCCWIHKDD